MSAVATSRGGRICAACDHHDKDQIDVDLAFGGESRTSIAKRYGMSEAALRRHQANHRNPALAQLVASHTPTVVIEAENMGDGLLALRARAEVFLLAAETQGNHAAAMSAISRITAIWELWGRATGALKDRPSVEINLVQSPEWLELRTVLFGVLQRHPEALSDVRAALRLEGPQDGD